MKEIRHKGKSVKFAHKVHAYMHVHTSKVGLKFTCLVKVNNGLVVKNSKTLKMFIKVNRSKMVNQSYLNMGQAGGFHVVNE